MLFNTYNFIFWFLPVVLILYHLSLKFSSKNIIKIVLLSSSIIFYALWKLEFVFQFLLIIIINYYLSRAIISSVTNERDKKVYFITALVLNLGFLFYYKYLTFFMDQSNMFLGTDFVIEKIIMPLGISFFTFIQLSYILESYQRRVDKVPTLLDYMQFVTYFPHLIAGPIVLYKELIPQFNDKDNHVTKYKNLALGIFLFSIGMFKKVVIADSMDEHSALAFDQGATDFYRTWVSSLSFTLQLYFDFSGYMDMALGISKMFNYDLPVNFNSPFKSFDISEYWRRWHITMTRFFMGYVYLPVTISSTRKYGESKSIILKSIHITIIPIVLTFLVAGIWHGAGWTFLIFGLWHGAGLAIHRLWKNLKIQIYKPVAWLMTFLFVVIGNVFFRSPDVSTAYEILKQMIYMPIRLYIIDEPNNNIGNIEELNRLLIFFIGLILVLFFKNSQELANKFTPNIKYFLFVAFLLFISLGMMDRQIEFLYWQF